MNIKEYLQYNENTGKFTWIKKTSKYSRIILGDIAGYKSGGYTKIEFNSKSYLAHRIAWFYIYGEWPKEHIDHINGIKDDNRIENLRDVNQRINSLNRNIHRQGHIPYVYYHNRDQVYHVVGPRPNKQYYGSFKNKSDAEFKALSLLGELK